MPADPKQSTTQCSDFQHVGVIGMGLMGRSIVACLLAAGHSVVGVTNDLDQSHDASRRIRTLLAEMRREKLSMRRTNVLMRQFQISARPSDLAQCAIVFESVTEGSELKQAVIRELEEVLRTTAIIATNTSAIPVTLLQKGARNPERIVGIHWDEPAHITRFMEIIPGLSTKSEYVNKIVELARSWGKEPSLLKREVRGFITNRISYAMFREACHLVDAGICTVEDVDRSLRNDVGWWMPFAGPFRYMDLMGVDSYARVMKDLLPDLCSSPEVPRVMREVLEARRNGAVNGSGFYKYAPGEAQRWHELFTAFNYRIRELTSKYSKLTSHAGDTSTPKATHSRRRAITPPARHR